MDDEIQIRRALDRALSARGYTVQSARAPLSREGDLRARRTAEAGSRLDEFELVEHLVGRAPDARADVWGWGTLMYEMLTGSAARCGPGRVAVIAGHLSATPIGPGTVPCPPALGRVIATALRRSPLDRYPDGRALCAALDRIGLEGSRGSHDPGGPRGLTGGRT